MKQRSRRYFEKVDGWNFAWALLVSLRHEVCAWKLRLPAALAGRFRQMHAWELFDRDQWLLHTDACFDHWKEKVLPHLKSRHRVEMRFGGLRIDLSRMLWEMIGNRYEQYWLFVELANRHQEREPAPGPEIVASWVAGFMDPAIAEPRQRQLPVRSDPMSRFLDGCGEFALSIAYLGHAALAWLRSLHRARKPAPAKRVFWTGISAAELAAEDDRLDFSWVVKHGPLQREEVLFFLPRALNPGQRRYLEKHQIDYVEPQDFFARLPRATGLGVLLRALAAFSLGALIARVVPRMLAWLELARRHGARAHFTTTSVGWPEGPELPAMNALGVKTVTWAYSANTLGFAREARNLRDLGLRRSLFCTDEFWIWNRSVKEWMEKRRAESPEGRTVYKAVGAMMCGNERHLKLTPAQARARIGLPEEGFFAGVFDVTAVSAEWQRRFSGGPPMIPLAYSEAFFAGVARLLDSVPDLRVIVKLKREMADLMRSHPAHLLAMLDESERKYRNRLYLLDPQIDPYLPVAAANGAIGMLYTSPILVALASGRFGCYYDPLALARFPSDPSYLALTVNAEDALVRQVTSWSKAGAAQVPAGASSVIPVPDPAAFDFVAAAR